MEVDKAIEVAEQIHVWVADAFPQQQTWSVPMISPPIWELPKTAFVYPDRL